MTIDPGTDNAQPAAATVRTWTDLIRRAQIGSNAKYVGMMLANYADSDGSRIFPGIARIAVECELSYKTVQTALDKLRRYGLIERVSHAGRRGQADEYRLIISPDLLERVAVLSPAQLRLAMEAKRKPYTRPQPKSQPEVEPSPQPIEDPEVEETSTRMTTSPEPTSGQMTSIPRGNSYPPPSIDRVTTTTHHETEIFVDNVAVVGARASPKDGFGFCLVCYAAGQTTLAADTVNGSLCFTHLREAAA